MSFFYFKQPLDVMSKYTSYSISAMQIVIILCCVGNNYRKMSEYVQHILSLVFQIVSICNHRSNQLVRFPEYRTVGSMLKADCNHTA